MVKNNILIISILTIFLLSSTTYATYISPYPEPTSLVRYGDQGANVKWVQDMLKQNGYSLSIDGSFGPITKNAVTQFQRNNNLEVDGIVGSITRSVLKAGTSSLHITTSVNSNMYTSANVNFRNGPSTSDASYGVLLKGTTVYVYQSRSDGWSYVKYNNRYGYINTTYLQASKPVEFIPIPELSSFNRSSKNLLSIIKNCKSFYANNNFYYSIANGVRTIPADKSKSYDGKYYVDCSSFVTWVLYEYASANGKTNMKNYYSYQRNSATFASVGDNGGSEYLEVINGGLINAKEGDILVTQGHVEFLSSYTKNANGTISLKVYNCGSDGSIKIDGVSSSATKYESEIKYILRVR